MSKPEMKLIKLPVRFVQVQLSGLKEIVEHHRENGAIVQFDSDEVERVDGAAVQFLLGVSQLQSQNVSTDPLIKNINEVLNNAFVDMGVIDLISTDYEQPSTDSEHAA